MTAPLAQTRREEISRKMAIAYSVRVTEQQASLVPTAAVPVKPVVKGFDAIAHRSCDVPTQVAGTLGGGFKGKSKG